MREIMEKLDNAANMEEVLSILQENGIEMTADDLKKAVSGSMAAGKDGELSEDALDNVAGGGWLFDWLQRWIDKRSKKNTEDLDWIGKW